MNLFSCNEFFTLFVFLINAIIVNYLYLYKQADGKQSKLTKFSLQPLTLTHPSTINHKLNLSLTLTLNIITLILNKNANFITKVSLKASNQEMSNKTTQT